MDIITDFGSVVGGSSPSGCTKNEVIAAHSEAQRLWVVTGAGLEKVALDFVRYETKYRQPVLNRYGSSPPLGALKRSY